MLSVIGMIESENWRWALHLNDDERCSHSSARGTWRNKTDVLDPYMSGVPCTYDSGTWDDSEPEWEMKAREKKEAAIKREEKRQSILEMNRREKARRAGSRLQKERDKNRKLLQEYREEERKKKILYKKWEREEKAKEEKEKKPLFESKKEEREALWLFQTRQKEVAHICNKVIKQGLATHSQRDNFYHRYHSLPREKQKEIRQQLVMLYYKENLCKKYLKT